VAAFRVARHSPASRSAARSRIAARSSNGVRVYVPFGRQWFPYFTRRLAERPANLAFFVRALTGGPS